MSGLQCDYPTQCGYFQKCIFESTVGICVHNPVFPVPVSAAFVYALLPFGVGIAILGGIGGGVLQGPILELMLNYYQSQAINISYCLMIGGCIFNTFLLILERNPKYPKKPIINFKISMIFNCSISLGSVVGQICAQNLPSFYITVIQEIFILLILPYLFKKGMALYKEQKQDEPQQEQPQIKDFPEQSVNTNDKDYLYFQEYDERRLPPIELLIMFSFFFVSQFLTQMTSSGKRKSFIGLEPCVAWDHIILGIMALLNIAMTVGVFFYGRQIEYKMDQCQFNIQERYFRVKIFLLLWSAGFLAGYVSGLLGYGSGFVMVPAILYIGIPARVASSTSAFNYSWLSLNNLIDLSTEHQLPFVTIAWFIFLAFLGGSIITKIGYYLMNNYKISYIVVFIVAFLAIANFISGIAYTIIQSDRFGFDTLIEPQSTCF